MSERTPSNSEFLKELSKGAAPGEWLWVNHLDGDPNNSRDWLGEAYGAHTHRAGVVDEWAHSNTYVAACSLRVIDKVCRRKLPHFGRLLHLPVDDVTLSDLKVEPSYVLETSPGNFQAAYFIDGSDPDAADAGLVSAVLTSMHDMGLVKVDKSGNNAVRYTRLPVGQNQKPREGGHWDVRVKRWAPEVRVSLKVAAAAVGIDLDKLKAGPVKPARAEGERQAGAGEAGVAEWTKDIVDGTSFHDSINRLAAHHVATGMHGGAVVDMLRALMHAGTGPRDDRWTARYADIPRAVSTAEQFRKVEALPVAIAPSEEPKSTKADPGQALHHDILNPGGMLQVLIDWQLKTAQRPQPVLALASALAVCATAAARKVMSETRLRTNLWLVCTGPTTSGKDHGRSCGKAVLQAAGLGKHIGGDDVASAPALGARLYVEPNTVLFTDEYGRLLKSGRAKGGNQLQEGLLTYQMRIATSAHSIVEGTEYADRKNRARQDLLYPCLNICATTTAETLWPALTLDDVASGLLGRMLVFPTPDVRPRERDPESLDYTPPAEAVEWVQAVYAITNPEAGDLADVNGANPRVMKYGPMVREMRRELVNWADDLQDAGDELAPMMGRAGETAVRLAMVKALSALTAKQITERAAEDRLEIDMDSMAWAILVVKELSLRVAKEVGLHVHDSETSALAVKVLDAIKKAKGRGLTFGDLPRECKPFRLASLRDKEDALKELEKREEIKKCSVVHPGRNGNGTSPREAWLAKDFWPDEAGEGDLAFLGGGAGL